MQIKTTVRSPQLPEWPKSRTLTTLNAGKYIEQQELSYIAKWYNCFGRQFDSYLQNLKKKYLKKSALY